ncbi:GDSL esterase/lipase At1g28570-like [Rutidosis leptorrhynchoides]|uniref:GDSL esterase/lipase At1g28570-like n=1 Tax=Rutidosis leptorrhynchoides TaxID=125765 RepID=UPI003A9A347F
MERDSSRYTIFFLIIILQLLWSYANGRFTSIISFGDSLSDTGNLKQLASFYNQSLPFFMPPYGQTFFHRPTGRCSNGRLVIDFVAESLKLPLVPPYVGGNTMDMGKGVNYAVAGATALDPSFLEARGVYNKMTNASLRVQMGWFKESLVSFCATTSDCKSLLSESLILMGEIGGNDYNHAFVTGKSVKEIKSYVPNVINAIALTINELIDLGAKTIVIPGNLPIGCSAAYLTMYYDSKNEECDNKTGCIIRLNKFAQYHNMMLINRLNHLQKLHPKVNIIYADYYNAAMQFYTYPETYGFKYGALKACCGGEGPFNCNPSAACAYTSSTVCAVCADPNSYANWDGMHLTEAAYKLIYKGVFQGAYSKPCFNLLCASPLLQEWDLKAIESRKLQIV